jgi:hypothetical protein
MLLVNVLMEEEGDVAVGSRWAQGGSGDHVNMEGKVTSKLIIWLSVFCCASARIKDTQRGLSCLSGKLKLRYSLKARSKLVF